MKGTVEMNKHEQWLVGTMERLQEVFLRHEKVILTYVKIFVVLEIVYIFVILESHF